MRITVEELLNKLTNDDITPEKLYYEDFEENIEDKYGPIHTVHSVGGGEGEGDHLERVWFFENYNIYLRMIGIYSSYSDSEFPDGFEQVFPRRIISTVYENVTERGDLQDEV